MAGKVDDPNGYCASLMRETEADCRRRALVQAWQKAIQPASAAAITRVAAKLEPAVRRRFLSAVASLKGRVDLNMLAEALRVRDAVEAMAALHPEQWPAQLQSTAALLPKAFTQAGTVAASILSRQIGTEISFDLTNPRAVMWARRASGRLIAEVDESFRVTVRGIIGQSFEQGIPPREAARIIRDQGLGLLDRQAQAVINYRFRLLEAGRTPEDVARLGDRYARQLLNQRARNIARTETISSSTNGQQELWRQAVDKGLLEPARTRRMWIVADDERLCEQCAPLDQVTTTLEEPFPGGVMLPPLHPSCLPGDSIVLARHGVSGVAKRWFDGDVVVIGMAGGLKLTCTPNHPILTSLGWMPASALHIGGDVICDGGSEWRIVSDRNHDQVPTRIQDLADTLLDSREMLSAPVPVAPEDFHGDGLGSQVAIVGSNRNLRNTHNTTVAQHFGQLLLCRRHASALLNRVSASAQMVTGRLLPGDRSVGSAGLSDAGVVVHAAPLESLGFGLVSGRYATLDQASTDDATADAELAGELIRGRAGQVFSDEIVYVQNQSFHGFVYNLQTPPGWFSVNGIISHNCRCSVGLIFLPRGGQ